MVARRSDEKVTIYGLKDPSTGVIRYVGKTIHPKQRLIQHLYNKDVNQHKRNWIMSLRKRGLTPEFVILEEVDFENWEEKEKRWISFGNDQGWHLVNLYAGDHRLNGCDDTETNAKIENILLSYSEEKYHSSLLNLSPDDKYEIFINSYIKLLEFLIANMALNENSILHFNKIKVRNVVSQTIETSLQSIGCK